MRHPKSCIFAGKIIEVVVIAQHRILFNVFQPNIPIIAYISPENVTCFYVSADQHMGIDEFIFKVSVFAIRFASLIYEFLRRLPNLKSV